MSYESIYQMRKTISLSQKLSKKSSEFTNYVGADPKISETIALLDTAIQFKLLENTDSIKFFRAFLIEKNKALFSALCSELSKLSFWLGMPDDTISAT